MDEGLVTMLDVMVGALLVAAAGLVGRAWHRGTRRADLPGTSATAAMSD